MRSFVIAAVMTALVGGLGFVIAPQQPGQSEDSPRTGLANRLGDRGLSPDLLASDESAAEDAAPASGVDVSAPSKRAFYQWTDERGSVRFAQSLDQVPPAWRERAGKVEVDISAYTKIPASAEARRSARTGSAQKTPAYASASHAITVYTAPWCGWCRKTLAFLDQRGVDYVNKNIEADEDYKDELIEKSGGKSIPFVEIDGTQIRGYNPGKMAALLE